MTTTPKDLTQELAERGWRTEIVTQSDGTTTSIEIPLTSEEFLHPQEGHHLPNSTFHDNAAGDAKDMLTRRYANNPVAVVFRDLIIKWGVANLKDHCPDVFVVFDVRNKGQNRTEFVVAKEGARPSLIIEVVSPHYRKEDREIKVKEYAQAKVQEYVIIDQRTQRGQIIEEVLGYRLVDGQYLPLTPDEDGCIFCETVELRIGLQNGHVVMVDTQTGQQLLTSLELEQRVTRLAKLLRAQGINPDDQP